MTSPPFSTDIPNGESLGQSLDLHQGRSSNIFQLLEKFGGIIYAGTPAILR
jgi:hypothetical protein